MCIYREREITYNIIDNMYSPGVDAGPSVHRADAWYTPYIICCLLLLSFYYLLAYVLDNCLMYCVCVHVDSMPQTSC